ncbi:hypothetical protein [Albidovulum sediminis]|uniref:Uncharacterized protein n=1 Tax=Albidovulum sediminis TaxID=3066345 RepID=A0ABT2NIQ8_9RHOB|nr:hypothetical protein [Defluviimonas sediminis]MCT8328802.1 hypothetical protein [Defluviimonas sediminis]
MLDPRQILRLSRWARHPPSARRVAVFLGVIAASLLLAGAERLGWLPEFMTGAERVAPPKVQSAP